jgi:Bacterial archaeo-eukaryotic release factor family 2
MRDISLADEQLQSMLTTSGPFVSLYLNTEVENQEAPHEIHLRWQALRERALEKAAPEEALGALDELVEGAHKHGKGLVGFGTSGGLAYRRHLGTHLADRIAIDPLPHLLPLIEWRQENPSHAVVLAARGGAEIYVVRAEGEGSKVSVKGEAGDHVERTASGGSERNVHHRAENLVDENAAEVANELMRVVRSEGIGMVVLAGDERALTALRPHLSQSIGEDLVNLGEHAPRGASSDDVAGEVSKALAARAAGEIEEVLGGFRAERAQGDLAADGAEATLQALRKAQVETLLIARTTDGRRAWFTHAEPTQAALREAELAELGLEGPTEAALADVVVRGAYATGASVRVIPELSDDLGPSEGLGALLRYSGGVS